MKGFTIFFAMLVGALALAVGAAIYDLTVRELDLSQTATQSQYAIYAADTGAECALYWDLHCTLGSCAAQSAFATSSNTNNGTFPPQSGIDCNSIHIAANAVAAGTWPLSSNANAATTTFQVTFLPQPYCVLVSVAKVGNPSATTIVAHGYNTSCPVAGVKPPTTRLERTLQVDY